MSESLREVDLALGEPDLEDGQRARLLADAALRRLPCGDPRGADEAGREALLLGSHAHDNLAVTIALAALSRLADYRADIPASIALGRRAAARAERDVADAIQLVQPRLYLGLALTAGDELRDALTEFEHGRRLAQDLGTIWILPLFHLGSASALFELGLWDDAVAEMETSLALAEAGGAPVWVVWTQALLTRVSIHRDHLGRAEEALHTASAIVEDRGPEQFGMHAFRWSSALLAEARGNPGAALQILEEAWHRMPEPVGDHRAFGPDLVRLALAEGEADVATEVTSVLEEAGRRSDVASCKATAMRCRGLVESSTELLQEAVSGLRPSPRPLELASACEALGTVDAGESAVALLEEAVQIYDRLGAARDSARAEALLRDRGVRRGRRGKRGRPTSGWASLTDTELKVIALIAQGLSNRQIGERLFISRRTVDTHVSHALTKLDATSRVELVAEYARRSPGEV